MSEEPKKVTKVPDGQASYVKTKQKEPTEKGFVGYETVWDSWQKEVEYTTPKKP